MEFELNDQSKVETPEELAARRRAEKLARKERRLKAIHRDKLELNFLRQRNEELEKKYMQLKHE